MHHARVRVLTAFQITQGASVSKKVAVGSCTRIYRFPNFLEPSRADRSSTLEAQRQVERSNVEHGREIFLL